MSFTSILPTTFINFPNNAIITLNLNHASNTSVEYQFTFNDEFGNPSTTSPIIAAQPSSPNPMLCQIIITSSVLTIQTNTGPQNMYVSQFSAYDPSYQYFASFGLTGQNNNTTIYTTAGVTSNLEYQVAVAPPGPNVPFAANNSVLITAT